MYLLLKWSIYCNKKKYATIMVFQSIILSSHFSYSYTIACWLLIEHFGIIKSTITMVIFICCFLFYFHLIDTKHCNVSLTIGKLCTFYITLVCCLSLFFKCFPTFVWYNTVQLLYLITRCKFKLDYYEESKLFKRTRANNAYNIWVARG